jgi:nitrite reductase (NADH) small subunit
MSLSPDAVSLDAGYWTAVGRLDQIPPGQGRCFRLGVRRVAIFHMRNGEVFALDDTCPHRAGPLSDGLVGRDRVICPLHGYKFALADGRGLDSGFNATVYSVQVRDGRLYVKPSELA